MKLEAFKEKLGPEWTKLFSSFITSPDMDKIYERLRKDSANNKICPESANTFNTFKLIKPKDVRCIIIGQEPYAGEDYKTKILQATGIALDCSASPNFKLQPSLKYFLEGIAKEYSLDNSDYLTASLQHLTEQGVLLMNRSMTVLKNKIGSHLGVWDDFMKHFFENVMREYPNVPIIILGKEAEYIKRWVFEMTHPIFILTHPSFAARIGSDWETNGVFEKVNKYIQEHHGREKIINWSYKMWDKKKIRRNSQISRRHRYAILN